jgi:DNA repair photolyase
MNRPRPVYRDLPCRSALNRVSGMPFRWSLNPYRGCTHACHYCYARATHTHLGLNAGDEFSGVILVKREMPAVLRRELAARSWKREPVAIGTATDPYQPCEGRYRITRALLEALLAARTPATVTTKSPLILRDLDLLRELAALPGTRVNITITTLDRDCWRAIEPGTAPPLQRLRAMERLTAAGIPCSLFAAPVIPGLTDREEDLDALAAAARAAGADGFWAGPLRLAPHVREHWLGELDRIDPALGLRHARAYRTANAPRDWTERISAQNARIRARHGFGDGETPPPAADTPRQLALFG